MNDTETRIPAEKPVSSVFALGWRKLKPGFPLLLWFVLGLVTSAPGLATRTPYYDEIFETRLAFDPIWNQISRYLNPDELYRINPPINSPPLYHLLIHGLLVVFNTTPFTMRLISWIAGGINVCLFYVTLRKIFLPPWPVLGALGFLLSSWHIILSQTARQHNLFMTFALLSIVGFAYIEKKGKGFLFYALALAAACHTYYWGILVVLPGHMFATLMTRKRLNYWRQLFAYQLLAGLTTVVYLMPIIMGFNNVGGSPQTSIYAILYFWTILVEFSSTAWGWIDLVELPWVAILSFLVFTVILRGIWCWLRRDDTFSQWLGLCLLVWSLVLFGAYYVGSAELASGPLIRKFALLQVPLMVGFLFGVANLRRPLVGPLIFSVWLISTGVFSYKFMASDYYQGSQLIAQKLSEIRPPLSIYSNYDYSLVFLLSSLGSNQEIRVHNFVKRTLSAESVFQVPLPTQENGTLCFSFMREGGHLAAQFAEFTGRNSSAANPDRGLNEAMAVLDRRFQERGWRKHLSMLYPGRISYQLACFNNGSENPQLF